MCANGFSLNFGGGKRVGLNYGFSSHFIKYFVSKIEREK
jgi:hypothetical protein